MPGAKEFLNFARESVSYSQIVFITDRTSAQEEATVRNMRRLGLFKDGDLMLTKSGPADTKELRAFC